jgi:hypothetical protein
MTTAQYKRDLERGKAGELFLADQHRLGFPPDGERRWDLERSRIGGVERIEVKTDSYDPAATPNFFMELLTSVGGQSEIVGGPWRARADKVDTFVYLYLGRAEPPRAFWFHDLPALVKELDTKPSRFAMRSVKFDCLKATGLLVPRAALAHLYEERVYV